MNFNINKQQQLSTFDSESTIDAFYNLGDKFNVSEKYIKHKLLDSTITYKLLGMVDPTLNWTLPCFLLYNLSSLTPLICYCYKLIPSINLLDIVKGKETVFEFLYCYIDISNFMKL